MRKKNEIRLLGLGRRVSAWLLALVLVVTLNAPLAAQAAELSSSAAAAAVTEQQKAARSPALGKLSTDLIGLLQPDTLPQGQTVSQLKRTMRSVQQLTEGESAADPQVYVYVRLAEGATQAEVEPYLAQVCNTDEDAGLVVANVALSQLEALAALPQVLSIRTVTPPVINTGEHLTEGDALVGADLLRASAGVDGTGVKIGVISDGLDGLSTAKSYGDIPADLTVLSDENSGSEGIAMLEILHDIAPGAQLYFHDSGTDMEAFNDAIDALVAAGCTIICDDVSWPDASAFEDGVIAEHVADLVAQNNVLFVSSAGNTGKGHYQGLFYDPDGDKRSDFSEGTDATSPDLYVRVPAGGTLIVSLQWDEKSGSSSISDYDLYIYNTATGSTIAQSSDTQSETGAPIEVANVGVNNTGKEYIAGIYVKAYKATTPRTIEVSAFPGRGSSMYTEEGDNSTPGDSIFGHAAVPGVVTCGAIDVNTPEQVEEFSSQGPVTMLDETRQKPDICGVDGVEVSGVGGFGSPFYGTSAAAPHVAAVAALFWQQTPSGKPDDIAQMLTDGAVDLGAAGYDSVYGSGRLSAMANVDGYYVVKFNSMGGSAVASVVAQENATIAAPAAPTKTGYDFAGWYKEQACTNAWNFATDTVTANTTLCAKWTPKTYTVTFNSQGGSAVPTKTAAYNTKIAAPTAPTRAGYSFVGWYKEAACTNAWNFSSDVVKANTTLYAKWKVPVTAPAAPTAVKVVAKDYQTITVSWAAVSGGAAGYELYRATSSTGSYALVKSLTGTSYTDGSRITGTTYYYKVRAWRVSESQKLYGGYSGVVSAKPSLAVPGSVKAQSAGYNKVKVTWQAVSGASGYTLYRATSSTSSYAVVTTLSGASTLTYTDGALKTGQTYYYKVRAWRKVTSGTVYGGYSTVASAKPILGTPGGFTGSSGSYQSVRLGWNDVSGASGYQVYRATAKTGTYKAVGDTSSESYTNSGLTTNKTYYYKVRAYRKIGSTKVYGSFTSVISAKSVLGVPKNVKAARASSSSIKVSWNKVAGATGYRVYRAASATGTFALVNTVKATTESTQTYTNSSLTKGKSYFYKVRAIRTKGGTTYTSGYSAVVTAKP